MWSEDLPSNSDNMQLVYPEPRQVIEKDGSSLIASNLNNSVFEKYAVVLLFSILLENSNKHLDYLFSTCEGGGQEF